MLKKIIIEKLYLLFIIVFIGGYSTMSMLTKEHDSIYVVEDPILLKLFVGLLFVSVAFYILLNISHVHINKIGRILLFLSCYMAIWRVVDIPITAGLLSYFYQPMRDILIILIFIFAYTLSSKSKELLEFFATGMIVAMLITAFFYYKNWKFANEVDEAHLGTSYYVLFLLPTLLLTPYKWLRYMGLFITGLVLFSSFKRGGLIAFVLGITAYLFVKEVLVERKFTRLLVFLIAMIALFIILIFVDNAMGNIISERILNIREDGGSNRDQVWATTWNMIKASDAQQLLFGHGHNAVFKLSPLGLSAHNDFLEMLFNYGIIGLVPYLVLHFQLIKQIFTGIKMHNKNASIMAFTYTIFFILSMISHVIIFPWMCLIVMPWGMLSINKQTSYQESL
jgi:O-antigen ligase